MLEGSANANDIIISPQNVVWPVSEHLVLEFMRSKILHLWPYVSIHSQRSRPSADHPSATWYWTISTNNPKDTFGASLGETYLSGFKRCNAQRWHGGTQLSARLAWNGFRNACFVLCGAVDREQKGAGMLNLAERKWLLGLLLNQISFNVPKTWTEHVRCEESLPVSHTDWLFRSDAPWIVVRYPRGAVCIGMEMEYCKYETKL
ncbi:hypothetical protein ABW20_dc0101317 [Dactylellina cionopaga]|nr:hypothetical protein ABW20_dc0101317 [Dactylellina cionopaga]